MSAMPPIRSSSSRSSKTLTRSGGMSSLKPVTNALNCSSTRFWILHSVIRLRLSVLPPLGVPGVTYSMYSFLFSLVTSILRPFGFRSIVTVSPKRSSSVENVKSKTPSISFSLTICQSVEICQFGSRKHTKSKLNFDRNRHLHLPCRPKILSFAKSFCRKRQ